MANDSTNQAASAIETTIFPVALRSASAAWASVTASIAKLLGSSRGTSLPASTKAAASRRISP